MYGGRVNKKHLPWWQKTHVRSIYNGYSGAFNVITGKLNSVSTIENYLAEVNVNPSIVSVNYDSLVASTNCVVVNLHGSDSDFFSKWVDISKIESINISLFEDYNREEKRKKYFDLEFKIQEYFQAFRETHRIDYFILYKKLLQEYKHRLIQKLSKYIDRLKSLRKEEVRCMFRGNLRQQFRRLFHFMFKSLSSSSDDEGVLIKKKIFKKKSTHSLINNIIRHEKEILERCNSHN
jgi:hypothetical protein